MAHQNRSAEAIENDKKKRRLKLYPSSTSERQARYRSNYRLMNRERLNEISRTRQKEYVRRHPEAAKARLKRYKEKQFTERRALLDRIKSVPCYDCAVEYPPYVMDFDHKGDKKFKLANHFTSAGKKRFIEMLTEMADCDVVCSNCHRIRTHKRGYQWRQQLRQQQK